MKTRSQAAVEAEKMLKNASLEDHAVKRIREIYGAIVNLTELASLEKNARHRVRKNRRKNLKDS
jgi:hypothetical protein